MNLNLLRPVRAVQSAFDNPNFALAILLVLLPTIISIVGTIAFGFQIKASAVALQAIISIASWIALGIILYVIAFIIEGSSVKGRIAGIFSALSFLWLVFAIMTVSGLVVAAAMPQEIMDTLAELQKGEISSTQAFETMSGVMDSAAGTTSALLLVVFLVVSIALAALALFIAFLTIRELSPKSLAKQIVVFLIFLAAWFLIGGFSSSFVA